MTGGTANLALFDFDGTITTSDTFTPFILFAVPRARIIGGALRLAPMILGYRLRAVSATRMRTALVRAGFAGRRVADIEALGARYAETLNTALRPEALARLAWHEQNGDRIVVVSASLGPYLRPWCEARGFDVICAELESRDGALTGRYREGDCTGAEKARRVQEKYDLARYASVYAYGDTPEDHALLQLAHRRFYRWQEQTQ